MPGGENKNSSLGVTMWLYVALIDRNYKKGDSI